ncbi:MAG TPA: carboxypeptidase-like regulatory domain-containing protein [Allosphingosinicella sp.]|nr:carboxypeptidase-like regulatory domain-containing protein [Allosphingosinicella sp.]
MARAILQAMALAACLAAAGPAAAQTTQASGTITLRQADGTIVPVAGAVVDIHRTDVRWTVASRTGRTGRYVQAGIPMVGTYTVAISAPGAAPAFRSGLRLFHFPIQDFELQPGDGARLTLTQIRERQAVPPAN